MPERTKKPVADRGSKRRARAKAPGQAHFDAPRAGTRGGRHVFPIVGIGASAGGLEALEEFFAEALCDAGLAYVVVQHLDPKRKGVMDQLLQRITRMPVVQAQDGVKVVPNRIYLNPPNSNISIHGGVLRLAPPAATRGVNLPIDHFFRSLAQEHGERSMGVILSGMGSDGTLGLRAIKGQGGATFVQDSSSAKFDGMPKSAIEAGLADVVAPADELPAKVLAYYRQAPHLGRTPNTLEEAEQGELQKVLALLRARTGNDFSLYKKSTIVRRIERRMGLNQLDGIPKYVRYLKENGSEIDLLFKELLIGVTSFFRDPAAWEHLAERVLPGLIAARPGSPVLRAWITGCSTGEEAYSLAIVLKEAVARSRTNQEIQIFATDLDADAIDVARAGLYPESISKDVSRARLQRFFVREERGYRVGKEIRETVVFATQNVAMDPPFTKLDLLCCRNLLIYLSAELQRRLVPLFHYSLTPGGILFLGAAETIGTFTSLFEQLDDKARLYRRLATAASRGSLEFPLRSLVPPPSSGSETELLAHPMQPQPINIQTLSTMALAQRFAPPGVLCSQQGDILYVNGKTGNYLEPAAGKANLNVFAMARDGLRLELSAAFAAALRESRAITVRGIYVGADGGGQRVNLTAECLVNPPGLRGMVLVTFEEVPAALESVEPKATRNSSSRAQLRELERALKQAREEAKSIREQMQASREDLEATNEELQSANEEMQSTNEELTTSKEELQSLNEELQTVNSELQTKVNELSRSSNDMKNFLNSTDIATLFLDSELHVRRFTSQMTKIVKLIPSDVGRLVTDINSDLDYPDLARDAEEVLRDLTPREKEVPARDGRWFAVRVLPYRTLENSIDGVVITFTDATSAKSLEATLRDQASQFKQIAESLPSLVWVARPDGACEYLSRQWLAYTGRREADQLGFGWLELVHPEDRDRAEGQWREAVLKEVPLDAEFRIRSNRGEYRWFKARSAPIRGPDGTILRWYGTNTDVDELKQSAVVREQASMRMTGILDGITDPFVALDEGLTVAFFNGAAERLLRRDRQAALGQSIAEVLTEDVGSVLEEKCRLALRKQEAFSTQVLLGAGGREPHFVRLYPHAGGVSLFFTNDMHAGT